MLENQKKTKEDHLQKVTPLVEEAYDSKWAIRDIKHSKTFHFANFNELKTFVNAKYDIKSPGFMYKN